VQLTSSDLEFQPRRLDFGKCITAERTAVPLTITNSSAITQTYGFLELPSGVSIEPNGGFGTMLPGEVCERQVSFTPAFAGATGWG